MQVCSGRHGIRLRDGEATAGSHTPLMYRMNVGTIAAKSPWCVILGAEGPETGVVLFHQYRRTLVILSFSSTSIRPALVIRPESLTSFLPHHY